MELAKINFGDNYVRGYLYKIISTEFISDAYDTHESIIEGSIWGGIADEIDTHK